MAKDRQGHATALERQFRVQVIADMIAGGMRTTDILSRVWEQWGIRRRQALAYVTEARDVLRQADTEPHDYWRNVSLRRYEAIYQSAMAAEDRRTAIQAQRQLDELRGLTTQGAGQTSILAFLPDARVQFVQVNNRPPQPGQVTGNGRQPTDV